MSVPGRTMARARDGDVARDAWVDARASERGGDRDTETDINTNPATDTDTRDIRSVGAGVRDKSPPVIVMKFGGSSVANHEQVDKVLSIVRARIGDRPVLVSSAHKGITDGLINAARAAATGSDPDHAVIERQRDIAASMACPPALLEPLYAEIRDLLRGIQLVRELSPRSLDYISSFGERMSVRVIADYFTRQGLAARALDTWALDFQTDDNFGRARPLPGFEARVRAAFAQRVPEDVVPIITGFVGKNRAGEITTLGRNGSDLTASLFGAALKAREVQIWSDTDGVMTADPTLVARARSIPTMRFDEAAELGFFGSRVLHPATLLPAMEGNIPVRVLNTNRPDHPGTVISASPTAKSDPVTSIAYKEDQGVLTIRDPRMFEQVGFLAKAFTILSQHGVVVDMVATSEVSVSVTSHDKAGLMRATEDLSALGEVALVGGKTILAVVGHNIHGAVGIGARVLKAIAAVNVNVQMHSFGMASNNVSMVLDDADIGRAVSSLHDELFGAGSN